MFSWRHITSGPAPMDLDGLVVVTGGIIHSLGLGNAERNDCMAPPPGRSAVNPARATPETSLGVVPASCCSVVLGLLLRRVRSRGPRCRPATEESPPTSA
jgi:hypothetical protein